ncbi:MAG: asparagine synthase (glutamine-hydrolyzing) [Pseudonocardiaceae bacterium]|jgi:asparagine synthase (glutamine-hydrolysing)|nr:asparagine synthase (glutamine-hydrolyzing) [Pseudonocardiaceae bacterium]
MCGITGWVDYARDLRAQQPVLAQMVATMACRGPDAQGLWIGPHVALGHRRLSVIDIEGGRQPMSVDADGRTVAVLTYSGEVYNYQELRAVLAGYGHRFHTESDTEVVLHAYLQWGEDFAERLNGMYAFALWDTEAEQLLLVRDRMGIKPLYYAETEDGLLFGSEPKAIFANPLIEPVVDANGLREILAFVKNPEQAVYRDLRELRPGSLLRVNRQGITVRRYWKLEAHEHTDDLDTTVATVRGLLDDIVSRQLISDVPLCTLLSGGLDSSAVTALAARQLAAAGRGAVRSFAVDFTGYADNFTADPMRNTPDAPFVHELARHVGADHTDIVLSTSELMDPAHRAAVVRASDLPYGGDMFTSLYLLFAAIRARSTVALSGESADEVFGGYRWFHDAAAHADTFPWLAALGNPEAQPRQTLFTDELVSSLDIPGYRADSYRSALAEVPHAGTTDPLERRMREVCYLHLTRFVQFLLDRKDRMSMASGLEVRVPFCDHRLVQYVFNTPWSFKTFDGREKSLLRAAVTDVLPASIAQRRKSPYPSTQDPSYELALRDQLDKLVADGTSPVLDLLDAQRVRTLLDSPIGAVSLDAQRRSAELVLTLHDWITETGARLDLSSARSTT